LLSLLYSLSFLTSPSPISLSTLSLHDALPICTTRSWAWTRTRRGPRSLPPSALRCGHCTPTPAVTTRSPRTSAPPTTSCPTPPRSEEHTSELQSRFDLVCRLLLEKKKQNDIAT